MSEPKYIDVLRATSRTFFIPISRLPAGLQEAVASAYLCMRAIDEIEDHKEISGGDKAAILRGISTTFQAADGQLSHAEFAALFEANKNALPDVTLDLAEWATLAPAPIAHRIWDATASMSHRMAVWAENGFVVHTEADLDRYTYAVAGAVGLLLSDLWSWNDGTKTDRHQAVGFGRGLQAVNIARNREEDLSRNADFYPDGWKDADMHAYCRRNLALGNKYTASLPDGPVIEFCKIPLALAHATLDALESGQEKLSRDQVIKIVESVTA